MTQAEASSSTKETGFVANTEKTLNDTIKVSSSEELLQKVFDKEKYYPAVTNDKKESFTIELTQAELNQLRKDISPLDTNDKEQRIIQYYNTKREIIRKANESQTFLRDARDIIDTLNIETVKQSLELMVKNPGFAPSVASELIGKLYAKEYVVHIKKDCTTTPNKEKIYITHENTSINPKAKDLEYVINEYLNATSSDKKIDISYFKKGLIYQTSWSKLKDFIKKNTDTTGSRLINGKLKISDYVDHLKKEYEIDTDLTKETISKKVTDPRDRNFLLSYIDSDFKEDDKNNAMNNTMEDYAKRSVELGLNLKNILGTQENTKIETPKCSVDVPKETKDDLQNIDWSKEGENFMKAPVSTALRLTGKVVSNSGELAPFVLIGILYFGFKFLTGEVDIKGHKIAGWQVLIGGLAGLGILKGTGLTDMELPNLRTTESIKKGVKKIKDKLSNQAEKAKIKLQILKDFGNNIDEDGAELITNNWHFYSKDGYALGVSIDNGFYKMDDLKKVAYIDHQTIPDGANIGGNLGIQDEDKNDFKNFIQTIYNKGREKFRNKDANFDDIVKNKNLILKDCINIIYAKNFDAAFNALSITPQQTTSENSSLTNAQQKGIKKIMDDFDINTIMDNQYRGLSSNLKNSIKDKDKLLNEYIKFIHNTQFSSLTLDKVIYTENINEGIFVYNTKLNSEISCTDPIKPLILKRILRVYFGKSHDYIDLNNFKETYREDTYKTKTVKDLVEKIHAS